MKEKQTLEEWVRTEEADCRCGNQEDTTVAKIVRAAMAQAREDALTEALVILERDDYETQTVHVRRLIERTRSESEKT